MNKNPSVKKKVFALILMAFQLVTPGEFHEVFGETQGARSRTGQPEIFHESSYPQVNRTSLLDPVLQATARPVGNGSSIYFGARNQIRICPQNRKSPPLPKEVGDPWHLNFGEVQSVTFPVGPSSGLTVLLVPEVHWESEAQIAVAALLREMIQRSKVDGIGLEGAFGPIDLERFQTFPDQPAMTRVADYLFKRQKISGAIHMAMTSPLPVPPFYGIDNFVLYQAHLEALQKATPQREILLEKMKMNESILEAEKDSLFSPALRNFDRDLRSYRSGQLSLVSYARSLAWYLKKSRRIQQAPAQPPSPNSIDYGSPPWNRKDSRKRVRSQPPRSWQPSARSKEPTTAQRGGLAWGCEDPDTWKAWPNLSRLIAACSLPQKINGDPRELLVQQEPRSHRTQKMLTSQETPLDPARNLDPYALERELREAELAVYESLVLTDPERTLFRKSRWLMMCRFLVDFSLTRGDWQEYEALSRLMVRSELLKYQDLEFFESFYRQALLRDQGMADNLLQVSTHLKAKVMLLVAGGFHTQGLISHLTQRGAVVMTIVPRFYQARENSAGDSLANLLKPKDVIAARLARGDEYLAPSPHEEGAREAPFIMGAYKLNPDFFFKLYQGQRKPIVWVEKDYLKVRGVQRGTLSVRVREEGQDFNVDCHWKPSGAWVPLGLGVRALIERSYRKVCAYCLTVFDLLKHARAGSVKPLPRLVRNPRLRVLGPLLQMNYFPILFFMMAYFSIIDPGGIILGGHSLLLGQDWLMAGFGLGVSFTPLKMRPHSPPRDKPLEFKDYLNIYGRPVALTDEGKIVLLKIAGKLHLGIIRGVYKQEVDRWGMILSLNIERPGMRAPLAVKIPYENRNRVKFLFLESVPVKKEMNSSSVFGLGFGKASPLSDWVYSHIDLFDLNNMPPLNIRQSYLIHKLQSTLPRNSHDFSGNNPVGPLETKPHERGLPPPHEPSRVADKQGDISPDPLPMFFASPNRGEWTCSACDHLLAFPGQPRFKYDPHRRLLIVDDIYWVSFTPEQNEVFFNQLTRPVGGSKKRTVTLKGQPILFGDKKLSRQVKMILKAMGVAPAGVGEDKPYGKLSSVPSNKIGGELPHGFKRCSACGNPEPTEQLREEIRRYGAVLKPIHKIIFKRLLKSWPYPVSTSDLVQSLEDAGYGLKSVNIEKTLGNRVSEMRIVFQSHSFPLTFERLGSGEVMLIILDDKISDFNPLVVSFRNVSGVHAHEYIYRPKKSLALNNDIGSPDPKWDQGILHRSKEFFRLTVESLLENLKPGEVLTPLSMAQQLVLSWGEPSRWVIPPDWIWMFGGGEDRPADLTLDADSSVSRKEKVKAAIAGLMRSSRGFITPGTLAVYLHVSLDQIVQMITDVERMIAEENKRRLSEDSGHTPIQLITPGEWIWLSFARAREIKNLKKSYVDLLQQIGLDADRLEKPPTLEDVLRALEGHPLLSRERKTLLERWVSSHRLLVLERNFYRDFKEQMKRNSKVRESSHPKIILEKNLPQGASPGKDDEMSARHAVTEAGDPDVFSKPQGGSIPLPQKVNSLKPSDEGPEKSARKKSPVQAIAPSRIRLEKPKPNGLNSRQQWICSACFNPLPDERGIQFDPNTGLLLWGHRMVVFPKTMAHLFKILILSHGAITKEFIHSVFGDTLSPDALSSLLGGIRQLLIKSGVPIVPPNFLSTNHAGTLSLEGRPPIEAEGLTGARHLCPTCARQRWDGRELFNHHLPSAHQLFSESERKILRILFKHWPFPVSLEEMGEEFLGERLGSDGDQHALLKRGALVRNLVRRIRDRSEATDPGFEVWSPVSGTYGLLLRSATRGLHIDQPNFHVVTPTLNTFLQAFDNTRRRPFKHKILEAAAKAA